MAQLLEPGTAAEPANGIDGHAPKLAQSHSTAPIIPTYVGEVVIALCCNCFRVRYLMDNLYYP
jgi:hypothetical protein